MDNLRRKAHKGFTLIELIIVMAIFSILLMAVISIAQPVSKIFRHADSIAESDSTRIFIHDFVIALLK